MEKDKENMQQKINRILYEREMLAHTRIFLNEINLYVIYKLIFFSFCKKFSFTTPPTLSFALFHVFN